MATTIIPAQPGYSVRLKGDDALIEPIIAWLFKPTLTVNYRPLPVTPAGVIYEDYRVTGPDGEEVFVG